MRIVPPNRTAAGWQCARLPREMELVCERRGILPTPYCLAVNIGWQTMRLFVRLPCRRAALPCAAYGLVKAMRISTSRWGVGQREGSQQTPLGLHRVAAKYGGGFPIGAVFKARQFAGYLWQGQPSTSIAHRILWLAGLETGLNQGGMVDSFRRYIYIHGFGEALTLGKPASHGCIHVGADDLLPLYDLLPVGTLVWIGREW